MKGAPVADAIKDRVAGEVKSLGFQPGLAVVLVGDDPASHIYVRKKQEACKAVGIRSVRKDLAASATEQQVLDTVRQLNADDSVHGIIVQLPLPKQVDQQKVIEAIDPAKDVDGFHPANIGKTLLGIEHLVAATPKGIISMLEHYNIPIEGQDVTIINRSNIVGKPLNMLFIKRSATVTVCHSRTRDIKSHTRDADIVVVAVGRPDFLTADHIKDGAVVVDVGTNRLGDRVVGDCDESVRNKASAVSPVPGGVGPLTVASLIENTLIAAKSR